MIKKRALRADRKTQKINYEMGLDKNIGDQYTANDANEVKQVVNHNADQLENYCDQINEAVEETNNRITEEVNEINEKIDEEIDGVTFKEDKPLVAPTWYNTAVTAYDSKHAEVDMSEHGINFVDKRSFEAEKGYCASISFSYIWNITDEAANKPPTGVKAGNQFSSIPLPAKGTPSASYEETYISQNKTVQAVITAEKVGLEVEGNKVVKAKGLDEKSVAFNFYFRDRIYYGIGDETVDDISTLPSNKLVTSRSLNVNGVTAAVGKYYYYCYPTSLGKLTSIKQNGSYDITGAFDVTTESFTNKAGKAIDYYIYKSKNSGAFTNVQLSFS